MNIIICCVLIAKNVEEILKDKKRAAEYNLTPDKVDVERNPTRIDDIRDYYTLAGFSKNIEGLMFDVMGHQMLGNIKKVQYILWSISNWSISTGFFPFSSFKFKAVLNQMFVKSVVVYLRMYLHDLFLHINFN